MVLKYCGKADERAEPAATVQISLCAIRNSLAVWSEATGAK
jgi:hypothetical protein